MKNIRQITTAVAMLLAVAVVQIGAQSPAAASPRQLVSVGNTSVEDSQAFKSAEANCPAGKRPIGGGGRIIGGAGRVALASVVPLTTVPFGYLATAREMSGPDFTGNWRVEVTAICAIMPPDWQFVMQETPIQFPEQQFNEAVASCPPGKKILGTGFALIGAHTLNDGMRVSVEWIRPSADLSSLTIRSVRDMSAPRPGDDFTIDAFAFCSTPPEGYEVVAQGTQLETGASRQLQISCPSGKELLGVGLTKSDPDGSLHVDGVFPDGNTAKVTANRSVATGSAALGVWAICASAANPPVPISITVLHCESLNARFGCDVEFLGGGPTVTIAWRINGQTIGSLANQPSFQGRICTPASPGQPVNNIAVRVTVTSNGVTDIENTSVECLAVGS